jgi:transposase-like protein
MDTNEAIRKQVVRLIDQGVSQKVLAKKMGVSPTWLSRWVNQKRERPMVLKVAAMDGLAHYVAELTAALKEPSKEPGKETGIAAMPVSNVGETVNVREGGSAAAPRVHESGPSPKKRTRPA